MGFFKSLLRGKTGKQSGGIEIREREGFTFLSIPSVGFYGTCSRSPDGRFVIGWADSDMKTGRLGYRTVRLGYRTEGLGSFVLITEDRMILHGQMERPNEGHLANNGTFTLEDWLFGDGLGGILYAVDVRGSVLLRREAESNFFNSAISPDGKYAVLQTCNSDADDGNKLHFFDVETGKMLWAVRPEPGWASSYRFDVRDQVLHLMYDNGAVYRYDFAGNFLDRESLDAYLASLPPSAYDLFGAAAAQFREANIRELDGLAQTLDTVSKAILIGGMSPHVTAQAYRLKGEVEDLRGDASAAIRSLQKALEIDPKIGCKKLLSSIQKANQKDSDGAGER